MSIFSALLLFGFLIFIHELGHFIVAKMNRVPVLKFSLGFGHRVIGRKFGETEYLISAVPLGGYVKMLGEDPEDEVDPALMGRSFKNQSILKRMSIIVAGPLFNLLTAIVIFFFIFLIGIPTLLPVIGEVLPGSPAGQSGLEKGDRVVRIGEMEIRQWSDMTGIIYESPGKKLSLEVQRQNETFRIEIVPERKATKDIFGEEREIGLIGVKPSGDTFIIRESLPGAFVNAFVRTYEVSALTIVGIIKLIQRIIPADTIGGPVLIFQLAEKQASAGFLSFFTFAAVISINLAILNLLPIPVLDGGHIVFLAIEAIRKKPVSEKAIIIAQRVGITLLVMLMAFAMYNDILRLVTGKPLP